MTKREMQQQDLYKYIFVFDFILTFIRMLIFNYLNKLIIKSHYVELLQRTKKLGLRNLLIISNNMILVFKVAPLPQQSM